MEIHIFNDKQCRSRSTLFAKTGHAVFSERRANCHLLREGFCASQIVSITNFVVVSSVGIIRVVCILAAPCKNVSSDICAQRMPRSACASAKSDQGTRCPLTESLGTKKCMNRE